MEPTRDSGCQVTGPVAKLSFGEYQGIFHGLPAGP